VQTVENTITQNFPQDATTFSAAEKQERNLLVDMERLFETEDKHSPVIESVDQINLKLHQEIKHFRSGVADIMHEMQPVKNLIVQKISSLINKSVPEADVQIYGSHAT
jgi:DNA polymerase sigma